MQLALMKVRELLELAVKAKASDLHLNVHCVPLMRIHGELCPVENMNPLSIKKLIVNGDASFIFEISACNYSVVNL